MKLDDASFVREQYESEAGLAARRAVYQEVTGQDPREMVFDAVAEFEPRSILEVGCGQGELAERMRRELGADVVALDQSPRMIELTRGRGVHALVGDVQDLPFGDGRFDLAVSAWMLFHVADLDRALAELRRVLRPGGRLVATTNYSDHLTEMFELAGAETERFELAFGGESGEEHLSRHFELVERRDADGTVTFRDAETIRSYLRSSNRFARFAEKVPELTEPLVARRRPVVFIAQRAA